MSIISTVEPLFETAAIELEKTIRRHGANSNPRNRKLGLVESSAILYNFCNSCVKRMMRVQQNLNKNQRWCMLIPSFSGKILDKMLVKQTVF